MVWARMRLIFAALGLVLLVRMTAYADSGVLVPGGKGSHRKFRHSRIAGSVILSGGDGDDALHYQEKQVRNAIREAAK